MTDDTKQLLDELVTAATTLVTTCRLASATLSEEFESMVTGPADAVAAVLAKCEPPQEWDGTMRGEDMEEELYRHESHGPGPARGVRVRHKPTGMSAESYMKHTVEENRKSATRALRTMVERYVRQQRRVS